MPESRAAPTRACTSASLSDWMRIRPRMTLETAASKPGIARFFTAPFYSCRACEAAGRPRSGVPGGLTLRFVLRKRVGLVLIDLIPHVLQGVFVVRLRQGGQGALRHEDGAGVEQELRLDELAAPAEGVDGHAVGAAHLAEERCVTDQGVGDIVADQERLLRHRHVLHLATVDSSA